MHAMAYNPGGPDWRWAMSAAVAVLPFAWLNLDPLTVFVGTLAGIGVYVWLTRGTQ